MLLPRLLAAALAATLLISVSSAQAEIDGTVWVSLDTQGGPAGFASGAYTYPPSLTANGELVVFESIAALDFEADANGVSDIYLRDTANNQTSLISVSSEGRAADGRSYGPSVSADGSLVVFESLARNLGDRDANDASDIYLRDLTDGTTRRVSVGQDGGDANGSSYRGAISGDGNFVAFCSRASNLVPDDANGVPEAFLWDRTTGEITRIPTPDTPGAGADGCLRVALSDDGGSIAFADAATGVASVYLYDRATGATTALTAEANGPSGSGGLSISGDGRVIAFDSLADNLIGDDTNKSRDVFVYDRDATSVSRVSVRTSGSQLPGDSGSSGISASTDGNFVVFSSMAKGVVAGDSNAREDVFRRDLSNGKTFIVSVNVSGESANNSSYSPGVNSDGSAVAFTSMAANLVAGDSNRQPDIFLRGTTFPETAGSASGPEDTGAPQEDELDTPVLTDDGGLPGGAVYAAIAGGVVVLLILGSLFLGRRGRA